VGNRFSRGSRHHRRDPLAEAARRIAIGRSRRAAAASHGDVDARLAALEREVSEVRTRVNALFFTVIAAALGDLVARAVLA
jgi:uncharacterized protein YceH (UPF0502 family)